MQAQSVGVDNLMFSELVNSEIVLTNARGTSANPIAEHVMALLLALSRTLNMAIRDQIEKVWPKKDETGCLEIAGDTLGILGLGNVGLQVAKRAHAFDMRILAVDATQEEKPAYVESLWKPDRLHELLRQSDFVAICCPLTPETEGMMGAPEFRAMKRRAFLINVTRGKIVKQTALIEALQTKGIAGAGLDVMDPEPPPPDSPLWEMANVIITPHHAGAYGGAKSFKHRRRVFELFCENLRRFVAGEPLLNVVDKTKGY
jgi:phosphoglycerate dehydrogenase-like enzyme